MPAYRSSAEAEVRDAVVARIRENRPDARIIHEINVSTYGPCRIDVLAVSCAEIIAVEIKSEKDKLDRLPSQLNAMRGAAHYAVAALHEKHLVEKKTNKWSAHYERDGVFYIGAEPDQAKEANLTWVYPERRRSIDPGSIDWISKWRFPTIAMESALPSGAISMLWRDELYELCGQLRVAVPRRATMTDMLGQLKWRCTGAELTRGVCAALRARECIEADPAIREAA